MSKIAGLMFDIDKVNFLLMSHCIEVNFAEQRWVMGDQLIILILLVSLLIVLGEEGEGGEVQVDKKNRSGILYAAA